MKKLCNIIFLLSFYLLFLMCTTRKKTIDRERVIYKKDTTYIKDSVFINKEKLVLLPTVNTEVISNPCDSAGNLKVIEKIIRIPFGKVEIRSEGNNIVANVNTDSINSVIEKQYQERNEKQLHKIFELENEKTILKVAPFNWWMVSFIASLVVNVFLFFLYVKNKIL